MPANWYDVRVKRPNVRALSGRVNFPQPIVFVTETESKEKGHKPGRYFHVMTDEEGYRWFHRSQITWKESPPEEYLADPVIKKEVVKPEIVENDPVPVPVIEKEVESEDHLFVDPESYSQLPEDWRQIFVQKARSK